jgi:hypothetical protein
MVDAKAQWCKGFGGKIDLIGIFDGRCLNARFVF